MGRLSLALAAALVTLTGLLAVPASAHSYADPALQTVLDGPGQGLPPEVTVQLRPSVVDELVLTNPTATPLEVVGTDGEPFLRISAAGVQADLASPDWYTTGTPEGGVVPAGARPGAAPRWAHVSAGSTWSEFDHRVRPDVTVPPDARRNGRKRVLAVWSVPLRYGGKPAAVSGHVLFSPIRGGLAVAVTRAPAGLVASPLQGELPGLFLRVPADRRVVVEGRDGLPFLRFADGVVEANTASASWREDQRARGRIVTGSGWVTVGRGTTYSWLDARLRYPADEPPADQVRRRSVVRRWSVPVSVAGTAAALEGTVTWVPRATALAQVGRGMPASRVPWQPLAGAAGALAAGTAWLVARRFRAR